MQTTLDVQKKLLSMNSAFILSRAVQVAAELGIADYMTSDLLSVDTIAKQVNAHSDSLYRIMRMLAGHGLFHEGEHKHFSLTEMGMLLRSDSKHSLRSFLLHEDEPRWRAYAHLKHTVMTGNTAFDVIFGTSYYDFLSHDVAASQRFDTAMKKMSEKESEEIVRAYPFQNYSMLVDIGGGEGEFLSSIVQAFPSLQGIVYDLPHVAEKAMNALPEELKGRVKTIGGSFFDEIPKGGDLYMIKRVLHNWNDEECITILTQCAKALNNNGTLLIIEALLSSRNEHDYMKDWDVFGMTLMKGRERTRVEWDYLFSKSGLSISSIIPTQRLVSIIEVKKINNV